LCEAVSTKAKRLSMGSRCVDVSRAACDGRAIEAARSPWKGAGMAKLYFYYASMNAGKSTLLLQADFNYRERGMRTMLWTAAIDDRYGRGRIASRIGLETEAHLYGPDTDLRAQVEAEHDPGRSACVLIDEAQFLSRDQVFQLAAICDGIGVPVLAYGLRTDFQANLFEGSKWLLALADVLTEIKAICACGRKATMNMRLDASGKPVRQGEQTEIGGNERYVAVCRRHFMSDASFG
jgi:thymidine kinase